MGRLSSILTKGQTILSDGLAPYEEGKKNFIARSVIPDKNIDICKGCRYFKTEPIEAFRVEDKDYPELSGKSCGKCGCILSYKLRQTIKPCSKWQSKK
jgi:hypothetical protein